MKQCSSKAEESKAVLELLAKASRVLGKDAVEGLFPKPFSLSLNSDSYGSAVRIYLTGGGLETLLVYEAIHVFGSRIEDDEYLLGTPDGMEFSREALFKVLSSVENSLEAHYASLEKKRDESIEAYKLLLQNS